MDAPRPSIADLVSRCQLGDMRAFEDLYSVTAPKLLAVATRILRSRDLAEDVLQDSFVSIWKHIGEYAGEKSAPMTWMSAIVRNRALDLVRKPRWFDVVENYDELVEVIPDHHPGPEALMEARTDATALHGCLDLLPRQQRQVVILAYMHGLTGPELAARLEMPLGSIKTLLRRSLPKLAKCVCDGASTPT